MSALTIRVISEKQPYVFNRADRTRNMNASSKILDLHYDQVAEKLGENFQGYKVLSVLHIRYALQAAQCNKSLSISLNLTF